MSRGRDGHPGRWARSWVAFALLAALAGAEVPTPAETPADVVVSGRTSTARSLAIVAVGREIPRTYAGGKIANTPGFTWYVSQHYALKSEMDEAFSREVLEIVELAYPHLVAIVGREPPGIDETRMAIVYAKSREDVDRSLGSDFGAYWVGGGGGVTFPANRTAYLYPSGTLRYHKRDLAIHECLHMLQMCVTDAPTPVRFLEGITYAAANHVYDEERKRLTLAVFDKATINNPIGAELERMRERIVPFEGFLRGEPDPPLTLYTQFFWTDPRRLLDWRLWRDGLFALPRDADLAASDERLMVETCGSLAALGDAWRGWVEARHESFHFVEWGWEQSGDVLWSYGWPWDAAAYSQTDVRYAPADPVTVDPLRMDSPPTPRSPLVGPVRRGVPEPSVGCLVDFGRAPGAGRAGLGLGVLGKSCLPVLIDAERELVVGGYTFGIERAAYALPEELRTAAAAGGHRYGVTARIAEAGLELTVRAGPAEAVEELTATVELTPEQRERVATRFFAVLSKDARHGVTPYADDRRPASIDLTVPAPANRWRFAGLDALYGLHRAAHVLGGSAPALLLRLRDRLLEAVESSASEQAKAVGEYEEKIASVLEDIAACGAPEEARDAALVACSGLWLDLFVEEEPASGHSRCRAYLGGLLAERAEGVLRFECDPRGALAAEPEPVVALPGRQVAGEHVLTWKDGTPPTAVRAIAEVEWRGATLRLVVEERRGTVAGN